MKINPLLDVIMNIQVFIFIGLMIWLYFKKDRTDDGVPDGSPDE